MSKTLRQRLAFCLATAGVFFCCQAYGSVVSVGNAALPTPTGFFPVDVSITGPLNGDAGDYDRDGYHYDHTANTLRVRNGIALPLKQVWFHMEYTPGQDLPQDPGATFDPAKWPSLTAPDAVTTVTGASAIFGHNIYMTWDIVPQPAEETFDLTFPGLNNDWGGVFKIDVKTRCIPEPTAVVLLAIGVVMMARRR